YEMLPDHVANFNYTARDRPGEVLSPNTNQVSLSRNKYTNTLDLQLSWSILDFGISYFNSKQKANEYLMLEEKKKTLLQEIVRDTRTAYWASQVTNYIVPQIDMLSKEIEQSIAKSKKQEKEQLISKEKAAEFRVALWDKASEINKMKNNLERAVVTLALLINVPTASKIELNTDYDYKINLNPLPYNIQQIEVLALHNRSEIREELLKNRIDMNEIYKARLQLIPNFTLSYGAFHDSTSFLVYNFWKQTAVQLTGNLLDLFSKYTRLEKANANLDLGKVRRQALAVSILTQVNIAYVRLLEAERNSTLAQGFYEDNQVIYENLKKRSATDLASQLEVFNAKISYFDAKLRVLTSHFDKLSAYNELLDSIGYNSVHKLTTLNQPIKGIAKEINQSFSSKQGFFISLDEINDKYARSDKFRSDKSKSKNIINIPMQTPKLDSPKFNKLKKQSKSDVTNTKVKSKQRKAKASRPRRRPEDVDATLKVLPPNEAKSTPPTAPAEAVPVPMPWPVPPVLVAPTPPEPTLSEPRASEQPSSEPVVAPVIPEPISPQTRKLQTEVHIINNSKYQEKNLISAIL
ncbi:MAG: TolC family protein, partial [Gammaproteobacteria bacterium]|nr:TolC family protein [Gammaproteobacteria bacterium]